MITFHLQNTKYQSGLQDVFAAFPKYISPFINALDLSFGFSGLTRCSITALIYILAAQYDYPGAKILEIGSFMGHTTVMLSWAAPKATIVAVEAEPQYAKQLVANLMVGNAYGHITPYSNITVQNITSMQAFEHYKYDWFDLIFVDGDHGIGVTQDVVWWERVNTNGLMLFHDYHALFPDVIKSVDNLALQSGHDLDVVMMLDGGLAGLYKRG